MQGPRVGQAAVRGPESHPKQALLLGLQRQEGEVLGEVHGDDSGEVVPSL